MTHTPPSGASSPITTEDALAYWTQLRTAAHTRLEQYFTEQIAQAAPRNTAEERLWQLVADVTLGGGKRLRPSLVTWAYQVFSSDESLDNIITAGIAWELLHEALLIHDDIIDRDTVRHGQPNIAGNLQAHYTNAKTSADRDHFAASGALLGGDLALSGAYQLLLESGFPADRIADACKILSKNVSIVVGGELLDTEAVMEPFESTDALAVAEYKTAWYSFIGPLQTGAVLAGAPKTVQDQLAQIGAGLGIAFSLRDDIISLFGDEAVTGKSSTGDVREGKRTLLLQYTFQAATAEERTFIEKTVGNPNASDDAVAEFRSLAIKTSARKKVEALVDENLEKASDIMRELSDVGDLHRAAYEVLVEKLRDRQA